MLKNIKMLGVSVLVAAMIAVGSIAPLSSAQIIEPKPMPQVEVSAQVSKIACQKYAQLIKGLIGSIKIMMEEKIKYYETKIQYLYDQAQAAFLAGDMDLYDSIMAQIDSLQTLLNQYIALTNQVLTILNQAYTEAIKNPCNIKLINELIKKASIIFKESKAICDKLMAALNALGKSTDGVL
jgi:hypothetical protein